MVSGIPTVNGYSGNVPGGYAEAGLTAGAKVKSEHVKDWLSAHNVQFNESQICIAK
jgi:hypothetical protein